MISIIVPSYNHAPFLKERFESIFLQTYKDYEIIILDDKSTDNSIELLTFYSNNPKVSVFHVNELNSGSPFIQWRKGIELSKGDYVWIAETDDFCSEYFLSEMLETFRIDKTIGLAFCKLDINRTITHEEYCPLEEGLHFGAELLKNNFSSKTIIRNVSGVLFKREVFDEIDWETVMKYKIHGDWLLYNMIIRKYNVYFSHKKLATFRKHSSSSSTGLLGRELYFIEGLRITKWLEEQGGFSKLHILKSLNVWIDRLVESPLPEDVKKMVLKELNGNFKWFKFAHAALSLLPKNRLK